METEFVPGISTEMISSWMYIAVALPIGFFVLRFILMLINIIPGEEDNDEESEEEGNDCYCDSCGKGWNESDEGYIELDDYNDEDEKYLFCKKCIDKVYPRTTKIIEKVIEKPILVDNKTGKRVEQSIKDFEKELDRY